MKIKAVQSKARQMGIAVNKKNKQQLIRAIQQQEGNEACYQTGLTGCPETACSWRDDCFVDEE